MRRRSSWNYPLLSALLLLGLACGPCDRLSRAVPTPPHPIPISTDTAGQLESRIRQSLKGPSGQPFILRASDSEVSSLLSIELAKYDESPVRDPRIWFTRGQLFATGTLVNVVPVETAFYLEATAVVRDGQLAVDVRHLSAGAVPLPAGLLGTLSQSINETLAELQLDLDVIDIEILEGEVILKGYRR